MNSSTCGFITKPKDRDQWWSFLPLADSFKSCCMARWWRLLAAGQVAIDVFGKATGLQVASMSPFITCSSPSKRLRKCFIRVETLPQGGPLSLYPASNQQGNREAGLSADCHAEELARLIGMTVRRQAQQPLSHTFTPRTSSSLLPRQSSSGLTE